MLDLHFVQHLSSKTWSNSGQSSGGHMTPRQRIGSALLLGPMPPPSPAAHDRSSGSLRSLKQTGQHVPKSSGVLVTKGGAHSMIAEEMPSHASGACSILLFRRSADWTVTVLRSATMTFIIGVCDSGKMFYCL